LPVACSQVNKKGQGKEQQTKNISLAETQRTQRRNTGFRSKVPDSRLLTDPDTHTDTIF
jgi:hypothetical protein